MYALHTRIWKKIPILFAVDILGDGPVPVEGDGSQFAPAITPITRPMFYLLKSNHSFRPRRKNVLVFGERRAPHSLSSDRSF